MKTELLTAHRSLLTTGLLALSVSLFTGCTTTAGSADTLNALGPIVAQIAETRIAMQILAKDPSREAALQTIADDLALLKDGTTANEITEIAIREFVSKEAAKLGLLPGEQQLLVSGLLLAKDRFIQGTGAGTILLNDVRVGPWIDALRLGLTDAIAAHHAQPVAAAK